MKTMKMTIAALVAFTGLAIASPSRAADNPTPTAAAFAFDGIDTSDAGLLAMREAICGSAPSQCKRFQLEGAQSLRADWERYPGDHASIRKLVRENTDDAGLVDWNSAVALYNRQVEMEAAIARSKRLGPPPMTRAWSVICDSKISADRTRVRTVCY